MAKTLQNRIVKKSIFAKKGSPIPRSQNDDDDLLEEEIEINEDVVDAVPIVTVKPQIKSAPPVTPYFFVGSSHWNTYKGWPTLPDGSKVDNPQPTTQEGNASGIRQTIDGIKLIPKKQNGNAIYEEDWSDKIEPWVAGLGLAADAIGLGTAATGVGAPIGATIALVGNVPNLLVDGYQFGRDVYRSATDGGANNVWSAVGNGGELALDILGMKMISALNKSKIANTANKKVISSTERKALTGRGRVGTGAGRVMARNAAMRKAAYNASREKALRESTEVLAKKGVRPVQGQYFLDKLTDEMAGRGFGVSFADALKSAEKTAKQNAIFGNLISGSQNTYHLINQDNEETN